MRFLDFRVGVLRREIASQASCEHQSVKHLQTCVRERQEVAKPRLWSWRCAMSRGRIRAKFSK